MSDYLDEGRELKMNYLVMEVHPAYAVVLDEEGRFLKAANLHYQVGDTVHEIIALQVPRRKTRTCGRLCPVWRGWQPASA